MGKSILGTNELDGIYLGEQEVSKGYLGDIEIWSASHLPSWFPPKNIEALLNSLPSYAAYYADFCFQVSNANYPYSYYRIWSTVDETVDIKEYSYYQVQHYPYSTSFTGWSRVYINATASGNYYNAGATTGQANINLEYRTGTVKAAIISSNFTNIRLPSNFEDYR